MGDTPQPGDGSDPERQAIQVLVVEDSEDDTLLMLDALRDGGYRPASKRIATAPEMRDALGGAQWDLILSDYRLPGFNAIQAFVIYTEFKLDIPFLIVSGVIGEETAVAGMKAGIHDYVSKNNLARLAPVVKRELREAEIRRQNARAEAALHEAYAELAAIHSNVPAILLVVDEELRVTRANELASRLSGKSPADLQGTLAGYAIGCVDQIGNPLGCGLGEPCLPCPIRRSALETLARGTRQENVEAWIPASVNGKVQQRCLLVSSALLSERPPKKALICALDITELKLTQADLGRRLEDLRRALAEKDVLFKEVQHRVKNNLQVISSLLSLQADQCGSDEARKVLADSRDRVRSMALIHEQLSHSGDFAEIEFAQYTGSLTQYLLHGFVGDPDRIQVHTGVDVVLALDEAMPCGLIVQELFSNSLKHAFPREGRGEIHIEFHRQDAQYRLDYWDNGIGLPPGFDVTKTSSLGVQLISDLAAQLRGQLRYFNAGGARFQLSFPARDK